MAFDVKRNSPLLRLGLLCVGAVVLVSVPVIVRHQLDVEWSMESLRLFIQDLGWWRAPLFISVITFRFLFLIPSGLLLTAAGVLFGPLEGTLYAGIGLFFAALWKFGLVNAVGRRVVLSQLPVRMEARINALAKKRTSAATLAAITGYPFIPKHVFHFAAALGGMGFLAYASAVLFGSFLRAGLFANLGDSLYSGEGIVGLAFVFISLLVLPWVVPSSRRWLLTNSTTRNIQRERINQT